MSNQDSMVLNNLIPAVYDLLNTRVESIVGHLRASSLFKDVLSDDEMRQMVWYAVGYIAVDQQKHLKFKAAQNGTD